VADLALGRQADIRTDDLSLQRYNATSHPRLGMLPPLPTA